MLKFKILCIGLLLFCSFTMTEEAYKDTSDPQKEDKPLPISKAMPIVDQDIRRVYWYFLRNAEIIYQVNLDSPSEFFLFFIYRNILGTFLCISTWDKAAKSSEIVNFMRLGNGFTQDIKTKVQPISVEPFIISLRIAKGQYLIELDNDGNYIVNGKNQQKGKVNKKDDKNIVVFNKREKTYLIDTFLKKKYWFYLRDAINVHEGSILTSERVYTVFTYVNIVGTFLAIGSCDNENKITINTFVRLGTGAASTKKIEPIELAPVLIELG